MKKINILLLQARKKNDLMIENELNCFSKSLEIEKSQFMIKDLTRDKVRNIYKQKRLFKNKRKFC